MSGANGAIAIPHTELRAWSDNTGIPLVGSEASWLHQMSRAYAQEISRSNGEDVKAPFEV